MKFKKITAVVTALCFLAAFTGQSFARPEAGVKNNQSFAGIEAGIFAEKFGKITEFTNYDSPQAVITIQDLHSHAQTQKNIASILKALDEKYTVKRVYTEGASGKVDISWLAGAGSGLNKEIVADMVESGKLTGSEYFAYLGKKDNLFGIEDERLHRENIARLGKIYENEERNRKISAAIKNEIEYLANKNLNPDMKKIAKASAAYHGNKTEAAGYYKMLLGYAGKINKNPRKYGNVFDIDPRSFTELNKVVLIDELSKKLNPKRINAHMRKYIAQLKESMSAAEFRALADDTDNLTDADAFFGYISRRGFSAGENSPLAAFLRMREINSSINPLELFAQEQKLEELLRRALASSELEREIAFMKDFYVFFDGYLSNKLTAGDEKYFRQNFKTFSSLYAKYASVNYMDGLKEQFSFINDYYKANNLRNEIFVEKINGFDELVSGRERSFKPAGEILENAREIIVIVAGGYHTLGVNAILDSKKISHITVTPKITESAVFSDAGYRQTIIEQSRIYGEALSFVIASQTSDARKFKNIAEAGAVYLGKNAGFDELEAIAGEISKIAGGDIAELKRIDADNAEIRFANGAVIALTRGADNEIALKTDMSAAARRGAAETRIKISDKTVLEAYFGLAKTLAPEAFGSLYRAAVIDIESGPVYLAAKDFFTAKAAEGADFGVDGAVPALEEYARSFEEKGRSFEDIKAELEIDGISYELLSRMPEFFQKKVLSKQMEKDMSDKNITKERKGLLGRVVKMLSLLLIISMTFSALTACGQNKNSQQQQQPSVEQTVVPSLNADRALADVNYIAQARVEGGKIIVTDEKGRLIDYIIKGVCYSRDPNGTQYGDFYEKDLPLLKDLGINSIRTYRPFAVYSDGAMDIAKTKEMLDAFMREGISITAGFSYEDMAPGGLMEQYLREFGNHPAILTVALGNEYNYHYGEWFEKQEWMTRLAEAAQTAKRLAPGKITAVVHGEIPSAQEVKEYKDAGIDLVMVNLYRGATFTDAPLQWEKLDTDMPFVAGEFGRSSKADDGTDTSGMQSEFLTSQIRHLGAGGGFIFSAFDEPAKGDRAVNETIGSESSLGVYTEKGGAKPAVSAVKNEFSAIADGHDGYYIDEITPSAPSGTDSSAAPAEEKDIEVSAQMYGDGDWRAYALDLGHISLGKDGKLILRVKTVDAGANPAARIEIRNTDADGAPLAYSNILLERTYNLGGAGETVFVEIPYEMIKNIDFSKPVQVVISTGLVFSGEKLNNKAAGIEVESVSVRSAGLELPFFSYILNRLSITKQKYPKARAAAIAALEAPLMLVLSPKAFVKLHGRTTREVREARLEAAKKMKEQAKKNMAAGAVFGAAAIAASSGLFALSLGFLFSLIGINGAVFSLSLFAYALVAQLPLLAAAPVIAALASLTRNHFNWNLANAQTPLDANVKVNMIYASSLRKLDGLLDKYETMPSVNDDGTVSQNIFIVNEKMTPAELENFSNTGISVDGKTVWFSKSALFGIVYYAEGVAPEKISAAVQNKKLEKTVSKALKAGKIFLGDSLSADYLEVDAVSEKTGIGEDPVTGNAVLYIGAAARFLSYSAADFNKARDIRDAQGWQRARSVLVFLDKARTAAGFENYLKILGNAGNGNIIITEELALELIEAGKLGAVIGQLRKDGISIMIAPRETGSQLTQNQINLFDGKFDSFAGVIESAAAGEGRTRFEADIITEGLAIEDSFRKSGNNIVIFESAIEEYVQSDRAGLGRFLEDITSSKILKYFASAGISAETAKETARNFSIEAVMRDFPLITQGDVEDMYAALREGLSAREIFALNERVNVNSGVKLYLDKIDARVQDKTEAETVRQAYMEGLLEKFAACVEFKNAARKSGFKNKNTERLAGILASFKYLPSSAEFSESEAAAIRERAEKMTAKNYHNEITAVINENPQLVPLVADLLLEMIFAYERETLMDKKDFKREPDIKAMNAILSAA